MFIELQDTAFVRSIKVNGKTTFQLTGTLGVGESIPFEQPDGVGGWTPVVIKTVAVELTATNTMVTIAYPALVRLNKPITADDAGVMLVS
jgi:hypothetical protein